MRLLTLISQFTHIHTYCICMYMYYISIYSFIFRQGHTGYEVYPTSQGIHPGWDSSLSVSLFTDQLIIEQQEHSSIQLDLASVINPPSIQNAMPYYQCKFETGSFPCRAPPQRFPLSSSLKAASGLLLVGKLVNRMNKREEL